MKIKGTSYRGWNIPALFFEYIADSLYPRFPSLAIRFNHVARYCWRKSS